MRIVVSIVIHIFLLWIFYLNHLVYVVYLKGHLTNNLLFITYWFPGLT